MPLRYLTAAVLAAMLIFLSCIKVTKKDGRTEVRPGTVEIHRNDAPPDNRP